MWRFCENTKDYARAWIRRTWQCVAFGRFEAPCQIVNSLTCLKEVQPSVLYFFSCEDDDYTIDSNPGWVGAPCRLQTVSGLRPKNSAEVRWRIEAQGLLKDSPRCDDATPIPAHRGRRLDEPTPTGCH